MHQATRKIVIVSTVVVPESFELTSVAQLLASAETSYVLESKPGGWKTIPDEVLLLPLSMLNLKKSDRTRLERKGVLQVGHLVAQSRRTLRLRGVGEVTLNLLEPQLRNIGVGFGAHLTERQRQIFAIRRRK